MSGDPRMCQGAQIGGGPSSPNEAIRVPDLQEIVGGLNAICIRLEELRQQVHQFADAVYGESDLAVEGKPYPPVKSGMIGSVQANLQDVDRAIDQLAGEMQRLHPLV